MDFIGNAIIIIVVISAVHVVFEKGKTSGINEGRSQILEENLLRVIHLKRTDDKLVQSVNELIGLNQYDDFEEIRKKSKSYLKAVAANQ